MSDENHDGGFIDDEFIVELRKEFLNEIGFLLEECEESFLKLEDPAHRAEELKIIFRLAHSIKGTGAALGFADFSQFAHAVEDLLSVLRVNPHCLTTEISSLLLAAGDAFKSRASMLAENSNAPWNIDALKLQISNTTASLKLAWEDNQPTALQQTPESPEPFSATSDAFFESNPPLSLEETLPKNVIQNLSKNDLVSFSGTEIPSEKPHPVNEVPHENHHSEKSTSIKIDTDRVDSVLNLVGELVVIKSQLMHHESVSSSTDLQLTSVVALLDKTVRELQGRTLSMRMTSLKPLFLKVQRVLRDLSLKLNKTIEFTMSGEDTEIDRTMIEALTDPLIHLARNAIDHGIEGQSQREAAGKNHIAKIVLSAKHTNGQVVIDLKDDGGGIPKTKVLAKARAQELLTDASVDRQYSDKQIYDLLFQPGFSTAEKVTDVSGRGVGLDVVKSNIEKIQGKIDVESTEGQGTLFRLSLPLTTAITDGMIILIGSQRYILPMMGIREIIRLETGVVTKIDKDCELVNIRGHFYPIVYPEKLLEINQKTETDTPLVNDSEKLSLNREQPSPAHDKNKSSAIVVESMGSLYALKTDGILGQTQVVIKSLGNNFDTTHGFSGGAILGDGTVALILDLDSLIQEFKSGSRQPHHSKPQDLSSTKMTQHLSHSSAA